MELFFRSNADVPQARNLNSIYGAQARLYFGQNARVGSDYARLLFVLTPANKRMNQLRSDLIWNGGSAGEAVQEEIGQLLKRTYGSYGTVGSGINMRPVDFRGTNLQAFRAGWASGLVFSNSTIRSRMFDLVAERKNLAWSRILNFYFRAGIIPANTQAAYDRAIREQGAVFQREITNRCVEARIAGAPTGRTAGGEPIAVCRSRIGEEVRRNFYQRSLDEMQRRSGAAPAAPAPSGGIGIPGLSAGNLAAGANLVRGSLDPTRMTLDMQRRLQAGVQDLGLTSGVDNTLLEQIVEEMNAALIEQGGSLCSLDEASFALQLEENLIAFQIPENQISAYLSAGATLYRQQCVASQIVPSPEEPIVAPPPEQKKSAIRPIAIGAGLATAGALAYLTFFRK